MAYDRLYPIGQTQTEDLLAELCALMFNMNKRKDVPAIQPDDFRQRLPLTAPEAPQVPDVSLDQKAHQVFGAFM